MALPEFSILRSEADERLRNARYCPKKMILIHTGIVLLVSALLTAVNYLLDQQIAGTGGLSGVSTRSLLTTVQTVLQLAQSIALPFWQIGYTYYVLRLAREKDTRPADLAQGFRRFGPVLRLKLITGCIYLGIAFACLYISSTIFMFTPWGEQMMIMLESATGDILSDEAALMEVVSTATSTFQIPILLLFLGCFLVMAAPFFYRFRMAEYWLMDHDGCGAMNALRCSRILMRGNCLNLLKIDLRFWWYFLLDGLVSVVCYGDMILELLGISLPIAPSISYFLFFGAYLLMQLGLYVWRRNEINVTYALVYQSLLPPEQEPTV